MATFPTVTLTTMVAKSCWQRVDRDSESEIRGFLLKKFNCVVSSVDSCGLHNDYLSGEPTCGAHQWGGCGTQLPVGIPIDFENLVEGYFVVMAQRMPQGRHKIGRLALGGALTVALAVALGLRRKSAMLSIH